MSDSGDLAPSRSHEPPRIEVFTHHHAVELRIAAPPDAVFAFMDDHAKLSSHMAKRSWMMGGGAMAIETDALHGRAVGSHLRLAGVVWGIRLAVAEVVTERAPPRRKVWQTVGVPRLLIIGAYQMGFEIQALEPRSSLVRVFIDYALPPGGLTYWLGLVFGKAYARWCTARMATDTAKHFGGIAPGVGHA